ncbi:SPOSA6832_01432 [Sporobolomyces salmonicolor]|uniref:SPOSA6832_01432-mRNA-1:cds n=1 Tax=Sporidiobolus salmonicolor TaxID=5005 RepID=A0A0D6EJS4_SPOSA|nr:SPOSA6832_01432 [Sporobolomyces salmonicolor]
MRTSIILAAALAAAPAVFAQTAAGVPSCVITCIGDSAALTTCASSDAYCLCSANTFINGITACMVASCPAADLATGVSFGESTAAAATGTDASASTTAAAATT